MVLINETNITWAQEVFFDQFTGVWKYNKILPHVIALMLWMLLTHDNVLDANSKFTLLVETRLIRDAHALLKLELVASAHAIWPLVHVQVGANAVTRSMLVVKANFPQGQPCKGSSLATSTIFPPIYNKSDGLI